MNLEEFNNKQILQIEKSETEINQEQNINDNNLNDDNKLNKNKGRGRPKGTKQKLYNYEVLYYDVFIKNFVSLGEFKSFQDISEELKNKYSLQFTTFQISNIYSGKTVCQFIKIKHL